MNKYNFITLTLIMMTINSAFAQIGREERDWQKIDDHSLAEHYIDKRSITISNDLRKAFILVNIKVDTNSYKSSFEEVLLKCDNNYNIFNTYIKFPYIELYSGNMLSGRLVGGGRNNDDFKLAQGAKLSIVEYVCEK